MTEQLPDTVIGKGDRVCYNEDGWKVNCRQHKTIPAHAVAVGTVRRRMGEPHTDMLHVQWDDHEPGDARVMLERHLKRYTGL